MDPFDRSQPATILFDLDGTLVDPFLGIKHCLQKISQSHNFPMPADNQIKESIGLGMREALRRLNLFSDTKDLDHALLSFGTPTVKMGYSSTNFIKVSTVYYIDLNVKDIVSTS